MTTEEKIVAKALEMFNERGIEYVGLRELAALLGIRVGNITYYFPTKDDLVNRLASDLAALNAQLIIEREQPTIHSFLEQYAKVFANHVQYRCLLLSFVHLIEQNKSLSEQYKKTEHQRRTTIASNLLSLQTLGYLEQEIDTEFLVSALTLIGRFWISEASVSFRHLSPPEQIRHYLALLAKLLIPYATPRGQQDIEQFLSDL
jgi:AcrR family transcriptional regulator